MLRDNPHTKVIGCAIFVGLAVLVFAIIDGKNGTLGKALYDWQTLITGILAVFAGYLTVRQMRETDRLQQERHDQLVGLNLRRDRLVILRLVVPLADHLRNWANRAGKLAKTEAIPRIREDRTQAKPVMVEIMDVLNKKPNTSYKDPHIVAAKDLFEPKLIQRFEQLDSYWSEALQYMSDADSHIYMTSGDTGPALHRDEGGMIEPIAASMVALDAAACGARELAFELDRLLAEYNAIVKV